MSQSNLNYPNNNFTNTQNYSSNNSSSVGRPSNSMFIQKSTIISSSKVDTSKIINPIAKKDWNTGTDALK